MTKELHNELYQITFAGRILEGFDDAEVRENVQALFRISDERTASLFSGATKTLKSGLSHADALVYQERLTKAGAEVQIAKQPAAAVNPKLETAGAQPPASSDDEPATATPTGPQRETPLEFTGNGREGHPPLSQ